VSLASVDRGVPWLVVRRCGTVQGRASVLHLHLHLGLGSSSEEDEELNYKLIYRLNEIEDVAFVEHNMQ